ncbi:MAG: hydroxyacid dehydrogenase [Vicinamibacterales bacterium]
MHILIPDDLDTSALAVFTAEGWTTDTRTGRPADQLSQDVAAADALVVRSATRVTAALIDAAPALRVIARAGVGVDTIDLAAAARRGVVVMNAPDATTNSVAELTLASLLGLARHVPAADQSMKAGRWEKKKFAGTELAGKTLGLVGCGRIGRRVAHLAHAFGMTVIGVDPAAVPADAGIRQVTLDDLCAAADYISLHLPVTPDTRHMFDGARLSQCKAGVRLVNTARGELIDETALLAALESGHVAGAALDVFDPEPPTGHALTGHASVIATPHVAASTAEAQARVGMDTATAVRDFLKTGVARNVVSPAR